MTSSTDSSIVKIEPLTSILTIEEFPIAQPIEAHLYKYACKLVNSKPMTPILLITILTHVMVEVETFYTLGYQKKMIVLHIISRIINDMPNNNQYKKPIQTTILLFGSIFIDNIVSATKGQIALNLSPPIRNSYKDICCMLA